jgi:hypothetical protein
MNNKLLSEEIKRFRMMSKYDPSKTLVENTTISKKDIPSSIPELEGKTEKSGNANVANTEMAPDLGVAPIAFFENDGMFPEYDKKKIIYLMRVVEAGFKGQKFDYAPYTPPTPEEPEEKVASLTIDFDLTDPFVFDRPILETVGETDYQRFLEDIKIKKENFIDDWDNYVTFLKSRAAQSPIYIKGYASIDGDPEKIVANTKTSTTTYAPCRVSGGRTRESYDKCLAQARANYIVKRIEKDIPEFKGIFTPLGVGQTRSFKDAGWPDDGVTRADTAPNRRFVLDNLPVYDKSKVVPLPSDEDKKTEEPKKVDVNFYGDKVEDFGPYEAGEYIYFYCKYRKKDDYVILQNNMTNPPFIGLFLASNPAKGMIRANWTSDAAGERDPLEKCRAAVGLKKERPDGYWEIGMDISGLDSEDKIPYWNAPESTTNILVSEESIKEVLGDKWYEKIPDSSSYKFENTATPFVKVTTSGLQIKGEGSTYTFEGWDEADITEVAQNKKNAGKTKLKYSVRSMDVIGDMTLLEIGMVGFTLATDK